MQSIEAIAESILQRAVRFGASDIHIIPRKDSPLIQYRVDNRLLPYRFLDSQRTERVISHFKFLSDMDIGEKRRPQNGAMSLVVNGIPIGLRLSSMPGAGMETLVIRVLPSGSILPIEKLALFPSSAKKFKELFDHPHGLIIVTGPTGAGKSSTLYSLLHYAEQMAHRNIITLEDPIENIFPDFLQVQINEKAGISYSVALKAALRHDPDIIMIGEIRDEDTARIAVRAAMTGHLIVTTMHTRDSAGAIYRLQEFGISAIEIKQTLIGVSAQRLLELVCPICEGDCSPYCRFPNRRKRASVYELLSGESILRVLDGESSDGMSSPLLKDEIRKAVAFGFVDEREYGRWIYGGFEKM